MTETPLAVYRPIVVRAQVALADRLRLLHRRATLQLRRDVDVNLGLQTTTAKQYS